MALDSHHGASCFRLPALLSAWLRVGFRLPIATKDGIYAGELNFHLHWTKLEPEYREVFKSVGSFVGKFRGITRPLYYQIDAAVDSVLLLASMAQKWWSGLTNVQLYSLVAVILALGFVLFLPALIVVPIVLTVGSS